MPFDRSFFLQRCSWQYIDIQKLLVLLRVGVPYAAQTLKKETCSRYEKSELHNERSKRIMGKRRHVIQADYRENNLHNTMPAFGNNDGFPIGAENLRLAG